MRLLHVVVIRRARSTRILDLQDNLRDSFGSLQTEKLNIFL